MKNIPFPLNVVYSLLKIMLRKYSKRHFKIVLPCGDILSKSNRR